MNSVYSHIKSRKYKQNTPKKEHQELDNLIQQFEAFEGRKNLTNSAKKSEENKEDSEHYLKFVGFLTSQNLFNLKFRTLEIILKI